METIKIEYGTDDKGQPQYMEVPKIVKDEGGNEIDFQDVLNKANGKIKAVTTAEFQKKYGNKDAELKKLQEKIAAMSNPSEELLALQAELEDLKIKQLPEAEQKLKRQEIEAQKTQKRLEELELNNQSLAQKYRTHRIITEAQNSLPKGILAAAREDAVEKLVKYADLSEVDGKETISFQNIFEEGGDPMDGKSFAEKFFSQPEKAYYLESNLKPGTGTSGDRHRDTQGRQRYTEQEWQNKIATAKTSEERTQLNQAYAKGEIAIVEAS